MTPRERVSDAEVERIVRHEKNDDPQGRGAIIPALAFDLRDARRERDAARSEAASHLAGLAVLAKARDALEEREAACCPEDVPFDEHIRALRARLARIEAWAARARDVLASDDPLLVDCPVPAPAPETSDMDPRIERAHTAVMEAIDNVRREYRSPAAFSVVRTCAYAARTAWAAAFTADPTPGRDAPATSTQEDRMATRCKFRCAELTKRVSTIWAKEEGDTQARAREVVLSEARFTAVTDNAGENKEFFTSTPAGTLTLGTHRPQFEAGKYYYLDITEAPAE